MEKPKHLADAAVSHAQYLRLERGRSPMVDSTEFLRFLGELAGVFLLDEKGRLSVRALGISTGDPLTFSMQHCNGLPGLNAVAILKNDPYGTRNSGSEATKEQSRLNLGKEFADQAAWLFKGDGAEDHYARILIGNRTQFEMNPIDVPTTLRKTPLPTLGGVRDGILDLVEPLKYSDHQRRVGRVRTMIQQTKDNIVALAKDPKEPQHLKFFILRLEQEYELLFDTASTTAIFDERLFWTDFLHRQGLEIRAEVCESISKLITWLARDPGVSHPK